MAGLYLLFVDLYTNAQVILQQVQRGEVSADLESITELVHQQSANITETSSPALTILLFTWLVSVIEAYRVGKKLEN
ncbi:MAG: hypothetical protein JJV99_11105 [Colwellia sp.]|nr:hypothetical protein [Colwellia sp.]